MECPLAQIAGPAGPFMTTLLVGLLAYCLLSVGILTLHARTRLYGLYLLKIAWVAVTIVGFTWILAMSLSDPGPKYGGVVSEFMRNPAGPFAAVGDYAPLAARMYAASPWWMAALFTLLLLWRGLAAPGGPPQPPGRARAGRGFVALSAVLAVAVLPVIDHPAAQAHLRYTSAIYVAAAVLLWAALPRRAKTPRLARAMLLALVAAAAAPMIVSLARFDWGPYTHGVGNYVFAWKAARMGEYMFNSLLVSVLAVAVTTLLASMAAYALARFEFVGRNAVLLAFIGAMAIPVDLYIVPLFLMLQHWNVTIAGVYFSFMDSRLGLGLIYAAAGLPFAVFLLTGFYRTLPGGLREAAAIDGCGEWRTFTDVFFPLASSGLATAAIFQFLGVWNEYQFALVFLTNEKLKTLPVGLYNLSISQQYAANWPALFAGVTILCLPTFLIFVILQERIVAGLTVGAIKE